MTLLVLWLGLMQIVADRGQRSDWFAAPWVLWSSVVSGLAMLLLIFRELRFKTPILDLRILKKPLFSVAVCLTIVHSFLLFGTGLLMPMLILVIAPVALVIAALIAFLRFGSGSERGPGS